MACALYVKCLFSRVHCPEENLAESLWCNRDKWGVQDFVPSCPSDLLCDRWEMPCMPLSVHCLIAVLAALNVRSLVTGLTFWYLCNSKRL